MAVVFGSVVFHGFVLGVAFLAHFVRCNRFFDFGFGSRRFHSSRFHRGYFSWGCLSRATVAAMLMAENEATAAITTALINLFILQLLQIIYRFR